MVFLLAIAVLGIGLTLYYVSKPVMHPDVIVTIEPGTTVEEISKNLESLHVIQCAPCFKAYIAAMGYSARLRAGDYEFKDGLTPRKVSTMMLKGDFKRYRVTIVEGWTINEIASYLRTLPFLQSQSVVDDFLNLSKDKSFIDSLGIGWDVPALEGYLFPDTYEVYRIKDAKKLIAVMVDEFKRRFSVKILENAKSLGLTPPQVVTMASIIEKETGSGGERPLIASVFYNRLRKGMLLQSDPTIIYGLKDYNGNIRKSDILNPHKYNTYVHPGLPPGPICNPGAESIDAALDPANSNYLYFVSKNDGTHQFSADLSAHNRAVGEYQRGAKSK